MVITTPDKPQGRHLTLTPPPVKIWCEENGVKYDQPAKLKEYVLPIKADLALVASYGKILPNSLLDQLPNKFLNIHPSLLPKYRGPAPLQTAIANGDAETGVTLMLVDEQMDHGAILAQETLTLKNHWLEDLRDETADLGAKMFLEIVPKWLVGEITPKPQDDSSATYTQKIDKEDGLINLDSDPKINFQKIRAYTPWPGTYFFLNRNGKQTRVIIKKAHLTESGELSIDRVIPEGKREMDYQSFE